VPVWVLDALLATEGERSASISDGDTSDKRETPSIASRRPIALGRREALDWVEQNLVQTRRRELAGNFNPFLVRELLTSLVGLVAGFTYEWTNSWVEKVSFWWARVTI
jgi:hypothetical protein